MIPSIAAGCTVSAVIAAIAWRTNGLPLALLCVAIAVLGFGPAVLRLWLG